MRNQREESRDKAIKKKGENFTLFLGSNDSDGIAMAFAIDIVDRLVKTWKVDPKEVALFFQEPEEYNGEDVFLSALGHISRWRSDLTNELAQVQNGGGDNAQERARQIKKKMSRISKVLSGSNNSLVEGRHSKIVETLIGSGVEIAGIEKEAPKERGPGMYGLIRENIEKKAGDMNKNGKRYTICLVELVLLSRLKPSIQSRFEECGLPYLAKVPVRSIPPRNEIEEVEPRIQDIGGVEAIMGEAEETWSSNLLLPLGEWEEYEKNKGKICDRLITQIIRLKTQHAAEHNEPDSREAAQDGYGAGASGSSAQTERRTNNTRGRGFRGLLGEAGSSNRGAGPRL